MRTTTATATTAASEELDCAWSWPTTCYAFGFTRFTFEFCAVVQLVLLHVSMIVLILVQGRKDALFRQAFFVQFVAVTAVDSVRMLLVCVE